jgi:hypothetical protein
MRHAAVVLFLALSSCGWTNMNLMRDENGRAAKEQQEAVAKRDAATKPGMSADEFIKLWGDADDVEFMNDTTVCWYKNGSEPTYFYFKNGKLIGRKLDRGTIEQNREIARQEKIRREDAADRAWDNTARSIQEGTRNMTPPPSRRLNCTSTSGGGGTVYTNCQ